MDKICVVCGEVIKTNAIKDVAVISAQDCLNKITPYVLFVVGLLNAHHQIPLLKHVRVRIVV